MKKKKSKTKKFKIVDRTYLGPKGVHTHPAQLNNKPGIFKGSKFVKKAGVTVVYENYNKKGTTDKMEWL